MGFGYQIPATQPDGVTLGFNTSGALQITSPVGSTTYDVPLFVKVATGGITGTGFTRVINPTGVTYVTSSLQNDILQLPVWLAAGTYTFEILYVKGTSFGSFKLWIDNADSGLGNQDMYDSGSNAYTSIEFNGVVATAGLHQVGIKVDTKNGSSSGYNSQIFKITLTRTA